MNKMVQRNQGLIKTLAFLLCSAALFPLFSLIIKGWVSGILFFSTLIAILLFILYLNQNIIRVGILLTVPLSSTRAAFARNVEYIAL